MSTWPNPRSFTPTTQATQLPSPHMISTAKKGQKISDVWKFGPKSASQESCTISVSKIWNENWGANLSDTASRILMKKWFVVWTLDSFCHIFLSIRSGLEIDKGQSCTLQKRATVNPALCHEGFDWDLPFRGKKIGEVEGNKVTLLKGRQNLYMFLIHIFKEPFRLKNWLDYLLSGFEGLLNFCHEFEGLDQCWEILTFWNLKLVGKDSA